MPATSNSLCPMTRSLASAIYNTLYNNCPQYARPPMKHKCELDLNCSYDDIDWTKSLEQDPSPLTMN